jgi:hypothetical protein
MSCLLLLLCLAGCNVIGVAAYKLTPPPTIKPKYTNLQNQSVGVMVWADRGLRIDWPSLQLDLANTIQTKLNNPENAKKKELHGVSYPVQAASIVRYQKDHPEIEAQHITEVAQKLGVRRLIYIEMEDFATRSDMSVDLFRGEARGAVRVIEIEPGGTAKVTYTNDKVAAHFPEKGPREGMPGIGDQKIYGGLIGAMATEVVHLFVPYQLED